MVNTIKAFDKSIKIPKVYRLFSKDAQIWFTNCRIACFVEWSNWKPNCFKYTIFSWNT